MKKILTKIISLSLLISTFLVGTAHASVDNNSLNEAKLVNVQYIDITRDDYLQSLANKKGISLEEADILDKAQTEESINKERRIALMNNQVLPRAATVYKQRRDTYNMGSSGSFNSSVVSVLDTKLIRYTGTSYGTYQKFVEILDKVILPFGSGTATYDPGTLSAEINYDTGYGNSIVLMFSGNIEHEIGITLKKDAGNAGFTVSGSGSIKYIARKYVNQNVKLSSNWDLN